MSKEKPLQPLSDEQNQAIAKRVENVKLTADEIQAYRYYCASDLPPIDFSLQARFFTLFLNGTSCRKIAQLNPRFNLGQVVSARIEGKWDQKVQDYADELIEKSRARVLQVHLESIEMIGNAITAANLLNNQKFLTFIQTGNKDDLGELFPDSLYNYEKAVAILKALTQTDKKTGEGGFPVNINIDAKTTSPAIAQSPLSGTDVSSILKLLAAKNG